MTRPVTAPPLSVSDDVIAPALRRLSALSSLEAADLALLHAAMEVSQTHPH